MLLVARTSTTLRSQSHIARACAMHPLHSFCNPLRCFQRRKTSPHGPRVNWRKARERRLRVILPRLLSKDGIEFLHEVLRRSSQWLVVFWLELGKLIFGQTAGMSRRRKVTIGRTYGNEKSPQHPAFRHQNTFHVFLPYTLNFWHDTCHCCARDEYSWPRVQSVQESSQIQGTVSMCFC